MAYSHRSSPAVVTLQAWHIRAIEKAVKKADGKTAKFIEHEKVSAWLNSWGKDKEQEAPIQP